MEKQFHLIATPGFQRDVRRITKRNPSLFSTIEQIYDILEVDPFNISKQHKIRKLAGVKQGEGQWRIRFGTYRIRYDLIGIDVVLFSFRHRKEAY